MNTLTLKSPAKLNLYLNVLRKRSDGYHDIETLFERIDLCDMLTFRKISQGIILTTDHPDLPTDSRNLIYRASELFFKKRKRPGGVRIHLRTPLTDTMHHHASYLQSPGANPVARRASGTLAQ